MLAEPPREPYAYAVWRVVPDLERGETLNVGVILHARRHGFLEARVHVDAARLAALAPQLDPRGLRTHLDGLSRIASGAADAGSIAALDASERFGWLVAPASAVVQPGPVHTGLCSDPEAVLERLHARLVL